MSNSQLVALFRAVSAPCSQMWKPLSLGNISAYRYFSSDTKSSSQPPPLTEELRERARQRIAEFEAQQSMSPNSPMGILERAPGMDPNAQPEPEPTGLPEGTTNMVEDESVFAPFPNNVNPATGEVKGPTGPEPTRFGDWERKGRCSDF